MGILVSNCDIEITNSEIEKGASLAKLANVRLHRKCDKRATLVHKSVNHVMVSVGLCYKLIATVSYERSKGYSQFTMSRRNLPR